MKRILLVIIAIISLGCLNGYSQSANRKGVILDIKAGGTIGPVSEEYYSEALRGGFNIALGAGYRIPTSLQWAFQAKLELSDNLSHGGYMAGKLFSTAILVGMRWTSKDFSGNKSAYIGIGTGIGFYLSSKDNAMDLPIEFEAGFNLTNRIALGLYIMPRITLRDELAYDYVLKSNVAAGVKLGFRF